jgi:N-[(2S)-2-amino-2-carboxyethyl]-L-glutamate dehydrogenase
MNENKAQKRILFLSLEDVIACDGDDIHLASCDVQYGFELLDKGAIDLPFKTSLKSSLSSQENITGLVNFLPSIVRLDDLQIYACKAISSMPTNVQHGLPRAAGLITIFDDTTKFPLCIMDSQVISATRTGGVSLLAAKHLINKNTEEISMIGAGINMRTQLLGLHAALPNLKKVRVYSRGESKFLFADEMKKRTGLTILANDTLEKIVRESKVIVTCLPNSTSPVVKDGWVMEKGVTIFNIGCYESELSILKRMDRIISDLWEHGKHRGVQTHAIGVTKGIISENKIENLGPILLDKVHGRTSDDENIFFAPTGLGFEDALVAWRVYSQALKLNIGTWNILWDSHKWI